MAGSSRSLSASSKRCGCGDEVVIYTAGRRAKNPGKRFRRCPNWKDVNRSCGLFEWVDDDYSFTDLSGGGVSSDAAELLVETYKMKNSKLQIKLEIERKTSSVMKKLLLMSWVFFSVVCIWCLLKCQCGSQFV
ncbi:Zinc finger, GRF-type [Sesbania bispinosa]|nr:Zinc finger, GRF-type [Sesbania bispinosa]